MYRTETQKIVIYRLLLHNQWRMFYRSLIARRSYVTWFLLGMVALYVSFILPVFGFYFSRFIEMFAPGQTPVGFMDAHMLSVFFALFLMRFLFQRTPALKLHPFLHLPIRHGQLVTFFQTTSLASIHNVYPLLFFGPFFSRYVLGVFPAQGAWFWLAGVVLLLLASNYANLLVRSILSHSQGQFTLLLGLGALVLGIDQTTEVPLIPTISAYTFNGLLQGRAPLLLLLGLFTAWMMAASTGLLYQRIRQQVVEPARQRWLLRDARFVSSLGPVGQLVVLECKLMWRNRRPKHYMLVSLLFSTVYLVFLLSNPATFGGMVLGAVVGLFASGGFVLNYGQLMFSWESTYFDGLLARNLDPRQFVQAKLLLLQGSCVVLFVISLPLFLWLKPSMLSLHVAFLFYNAGVTSLLILLLALHNRERIDLSKSGGFFNYEGFSVVHWLWFFPTMIPPVLILFFLRARPDLGLLVLSTMGAVGLLLSRYWNQYFARVLSRNRYKMAEGFKDDR